MPLCPALSGNKKLVQPAFASLYPGCKTLCLGCEALHPCTLTPCPHALPSVGTKKLVQTVLTPRVQDLCLLTQGTRPHAIVPLCFAISCPALSGEQKTSSNYPCTQGMRPHAHHTQGASPHNLTPRMQGLAPSFPHTLPSYPDALPLVDTPLCPGLVPSHPS